MVKLNDCLDPGREKREPVVRKMLAGVRTILAFAFVGFVRLTWHVKRFLVEYDSPGLTSILVDPLDVSRRRKNRNRLLRTDRSEEDQRYPSLFE